MATTETGGLFTTTPLPPRNSSASQPNADPMGPGAVPLEHDGTGDGVPVCVDERPPVPVPVAVGTTMAGLLDNRIVNSVETGLGGGGVNPPSPILIVDDSDSEAGPAMKKRRIDLAGLAAVSVNG